MRARMPLATLPALLLAVLVAAGGQAAAEELLVNGDFSHGGNGWTALGLHFETGSCSGHDSAAILGPDSDEMGRLVSDAVPIEPGESYEASGYGLFVDGADQSSRLWLVLAFYQTADSTELPLWGKVSAHLSPYATNYISMTTGPAVASPEARYARLRVEFPASGPATACVDDLSLAGPRPSPTETPSSTPTPPPPPPPTPPPPATG